MNLSKFQKEVHEIARSKGWYDPPKTDLECLMLMVAEISEAAEHIRNGTEAMHYTGNDKPDGLAIELADVVLRILDYAEYKQLDLYSALMIKNEYNKTRPYRHGKKL